jgi:phosphatidylserine decarboxylase
MAREGIPFVVAFIAPALLFAIVGLWVGAAALLLIAGYMAYFFRDPVRHPPADERFVVSPADGKVVRVAPADPESAESATQISIFLSPLNVHINRSPIGGEVVGVVHKAGAFHIASRDIASVENEQNVVTVRGRNVTIVFRQIAGVLARRVVCWKRAGDHVGIGERIGLMKFGSRMDVLLPHEVAVLVGKGDRVIGGITVIGRLQNTPGEGGIND